jgi:hypothetical protein
LIGGVYVGDMTNRNFVTNPMQAQVIPGALKTGGVGTALLDPSQDGTCKAVFAVVTADGAIVQEHTKKGLDGLARRGTVRPILGGNGNAQQEAVEPRFGVIMNPYTNPLTPVVRQPAASVDSAQPSPRSQSERLGTPPKRNERTLCEPPRRNALSSLRPISESCAPSQAMNTTPERKRAGHASPRSGRVIKSMAPLEPAA